MWSKIEISHFKKVPRDNLEILVVSKSGPDSRNLVARSSAENKQKQQQQKIRELMLPIKI